MNRWMYVATSSYILQVNIIVETIILGVQPWKVGARGLK